VVQFMVALGVTGELDYSDDIDCVDEDSILCRLRKGTLSWPQPDGTSTSSTSDCPSAPYSQGCAPNIDDTWHAALESRGTFANASNPQDLVDQLTAIITSILQRRGTSTALSATLSVLTAGTQGYSAGYDTSDGSGFLIKQDLDATTGDPGDIAWDAGCVLTGGSCATPDAPVDEGDGTDPDDRKLYTMSDAGALIEFKWANLSDTQKAALNQDPDSDTTCISATGDDSGCDGDGEKRLDWLRGETDTGFRHRTSILGAIINSQPQYVSAPTGGFMDAFPSDSAETDAAVSGDSYQEFVQANKTRVPTVYVGADDGMLHAFNAVDGTERWAYVPKILLDNGTLDHLPSSQEPGVDDTPVVQDVFYDGAWHSILVATLRLGGRGVFALDVTDPATPKLLWEIDSSKTGFGHLGYTYGSANIARLNTGKWAVLVSSGYFPQDPVPSDDDDATQTSLFVVNAQTGALIREIQTSGATATYGLSTPAVFDSDSDQVDDIAAAGDLAGNLWRFDLSSTDSASWSVDQIFTTYTTEAEIGTRPITVMPVAMRDPASGHPIWIFGTGKYLSARCDNSAVTPPDDCGADSNSATQAFYGIRDYGTGSANYPIAVGDLRDQTLTQAGTGVRSLTHNALDQDADGEPEAKQGWRIQLNISTEPGERNVISVVPVYSVNEAILTTIIPKGSDPCDPGRRGAIMVVDAATGGSFNDGGRAPSFGARSNPDVVGKVFETENLPISGIPSVVAQEGGPILMPGLPGFEIPMPSPHRGAWRELLDLL
jgi:type IV pilus assembly protein PilY1